VRTVGGVSLGGKERVAVVEIGDTWLVLGAAPGSVRLLHTLPAPHASTRDTGTTPPGSNDLDADAAQGPSAGTFGSRFRAALADEARKRFSRPSGGGK
jgi:flagellar protein FliO/FliZ